jgi:RNA polymerase sigma-70 factor (sigma-E family)
MARSYQWQRRATELRPASFKWDEPVARSDFLMNRRDEEFQAFVLDRRPALLRTSTALTGGDLHLAEDLVQKCLIKLYVSWSRVRSMHVESYARRALVHGLIDEKRAAFHRHERAWAEPPDEARSDVETQAFDRQLLWALGQLAPRMRAAVVLRHVEGLSTEEAAHALRCSTGTVKSQTARGLARLRELLCQEQHESIGSDRSPEPEPTFQGEQP